jgi:hypothetical protein
MTDSALDGEIAGQRCDYDGEIREFIDAMRKARNRAYAPMRLQMDTYYTYRPIVGSAVDIDGRRALIEAARRELDLWERRLK